MIEIQYLIKPLLVGVVLSLSASLISPFIVFNNKAMIADGLSHIAFTAIILGYLFSEQPMFFSIPIIIMISLLISYINEKVNIEFDSGIAVVSSLSLAIGLIIATVIPGFNRSIESLLVGSILTSNSQDVYAGILLLILTIIIVVKNYWDLMMVSFDPSYAKSREKSVLKFNSILNILVAIYIVVGIRIVGTLLIASFIIFPGLVSGLISKNAKELTFLSVLVSIINVLLGIIISFGIGWPTGPTIVVTFGILYVLSSVIKI